MEVSNVLALAERKKRITSADARHFVGLLKNLQIEIAPVESAKSVLSLYLLAREWGLTSYDAAYLELALEAGAPLATRDKTLRAAATKAGVEVI